MLFQKKPVIIEAVQWTGQDSWDDIKKLESKNTKELKIVWHTCHNELSIDTLEGTMYAHLGDWIILGVDGELYPCRPYIFELSYEEIK